ncbi:MAG: hypothetical protein ACRDI2_19160 [Chloroflexota bacterium]
MTNAQALPTIDEAQSLFGISALALAEAASCRPDRLARLLAGRGRLTGLKAAARVAAVAHREAHRQVVAAGLGWIVDDQIEGALSYAEAIHGARRPEALAA